MRISKSLALSFVSGVLVSAASDVVSLNKDTFSDYIKENSLVLAKFYAPWCGHCKSLAPEFEEAASTLTEKNIRLVKIDCTTEEELCKRYEVDGYPTLKIFRGLDDVTPYSGPRKAPGIVSNMVKWSLPAVSILNKETIEDFKKADQVVLVGYFDSSDKASNTTYIEIAEKLRETYLFGATHDADLAKSEDVTFPAVVLYKSFDEGKVIHSGKFDADEIEKFASDASTPLIGHISPESYTMYMSTGIPLAYIFSTSDEERKSLSDTLRPVAKKFKGKINFATINAESFGGFASNLNLKADKFPAFAIQRTIGNIKFPYDQDKEITAEAIDEFITQIVDGTLKPTIKSEPIPESQKGPVTVVVADNFDEIVMDDSKDVLVEFYAPWCGFCKSLAPLYNTLGQLYIDAGVTDKVTIAKIDATANDFTVSIDGFPTILLFKAGDKQNPITYEGEREVQDFIDFVKQGKHGVSVEYTAEKKEKESTAGEESKEEDKAKVDTDDDSSDEHDEL